MSIGKEVLPFGEEPVLIIFSLYRILGTNSHNIFNISIPLIMEYRKENQFIFTINCRKQKEKKQEQ